MDLSTYLHRAWMANAYHKVIFKVKVDCTLFISPEIWIFRFLTFYIFSKYPLLLHSLATVQILETWEVHISKTSRWWDVFWSADPNRIPAREFCGWTAGPPCGPHTCQRCGSSEGIPTPSFALNFTENENYMTHYVEKGYLSTDWLDLEYIPQWSEEQQGNSLSIFVRISKPFPMLNYPGCVRQ